MLLLLLLAWTSEHGGWGDMGLHSEMNRAAVCC